MIPDKGILFVRGNERGGGEAQRPVLYVDEPIMTGAISARLHSATKPHLVCHLKLLGIGGGEGGWGGGGKIVN